jgi:hypothetical protein
MTLINGTIKDSGGQPLAGILRVTLDAPIVNAATVPDSLHTMQTRAFPIGVTGAVALDLPETQTKSITYHFEFASTATQTDYFLTDGTSYTGPKHLHTDSNYYTGAVHTTDSKLLSPQTNTYETSVFDFHAVVPNVVSVEFATLLPTGVATDILDTSLRYLAEIIANTPAYVNILRGGPRFQGVYSPTAYYQQADAVTYGGSSWLYIGSTIGVGKTPSLANTAYWQLLAQKGDPGGTGGNDTAYDPTGWAGALDAPSRNAVRNALVTLATQAHLAAYAPLNSPVLTGTPSRNFSPLLADNSTQLTTTGWVRQYAAPIESPVLTGNPAVPTQSITDSSGKAASTQHVTDKLNAYSLGTLVVAEQATAVVLTSGTLTKIPWDTENYDLGGLFSNGVFTPAATDFYSFELSLYIQSGSANTVCDVWLYRIDTSATEKMIAAGQTGVSAVPIFSGHPGILLQAGAPYDIRARVAATSPQIQALTTFSNRLVIRRIRI